MLPYLQDFELSFKDVGYVFGSKASSQNLTITPTKKWLLSDSQRSLLPRTPRNSRNSILSRRSDAADHPETGVYGANTPLLGSRSSFSDSFSSSTRKLNEVRERIGFVRMLTVC